MIGYTLAECFIAGANLALTAAEEQMSEEDHNALCKVVEGRLKEVIDAANLNEEAT